MPTENSVPTTHIRRGQPGAEPVTGLAAPARRALEGAGITTLGDLATHTEADLLKLHGFGPASLPKLRQALESAGLAFAE